MMPPRSNSPRSRLLDLSIGSGLRYLLADPENRNVLKFTGWLAVFGPSWEHVQRRGKVSPEWYAQQRARKERTPAYVYAPWPCMKSWRNP